MHCRPVLKFHNLFSRISYERSARSTHISKWRRVYWTEIPQFYCDKARHGRSGFLIPALAEGLFIICNVHTGFGADQATYWMGTVFFLGDKAAGAWGWPLPHLAQRLGMSGAVSALPLRSHGDDRGKFNFAFTKGCRRVYGVLNPQERKVYIEDRSVCWVNGRVGNYKLTKMFNRFLQNEQGDTPEGSALRYKSRIWKTILKMSTRSTCFSLIHKWKDIFIVIAPLDWCICVMNCCVLCPSRRIDWDKPVARRRAVPESSDLALQNNHVSCDTTLPFPES